jgi:hypothetical protein
MNLENVGKNIEFASISMENFALGSVWDSSMYYSICDSVNFFVENSVENSVNFRLQQPIRQKKQG